MKKIQINASMGGSGKTTLAGIAEFIKRGQAAQQAVDAILAAERSKQKS
jgi:hypothetical protein